MDIELASAVIPNTSINNTTTIHIPIEISDGNRTNHQDQVITFVSFKTTKMIVNTVAIDKPFLLFSIFLFI